MKNPESNPSFREVSRHSTIYKTVGGLSHFINSECILTSNQIVTKGKHYFVASFNSHADAPEISKIKLLDAYYSKDHFYLFVKNLDDDRVYIIELSTYCTESECPWLLSDVENFQEFLNDIAIKKYCRDCDSA